ncbi:NAD(P)-binding domain-containing protein [Dongshaea marina]|uniref:NAD(P)-binding domain-containing protein n=1 Tax=Dongshaea marina TaxID=2047966 RepID=UPI00131F3C02|nr:NAD(P)-binding domain-containing protein [Dongshaea marina]
MKITVIGCGHGGQALAAHLSLLDHQVTLYADEKHPGYLHQIKDRQITLEGAIEGKASIHRLTTNIKDAVRDAQIIYLSLPTDAHFQQFKKMLKFLDEGQLVVTLAGNYSSIYFYQEMVRVAKHKKVLLADLASLPYACRTENPGRVYVIDVKKEVSIAAMPALDTPG